ncbi:DUF6391 domain-containing protein [Limnoraphis robusta Tam1]|uniref:DUF6391 domain-containing protein n=1 Tax=Limnoraphis robusta CCNP1315 TaxID=3110306 RepID=A0ABU5TX17_9CYAN|nr:DUF6391 domain-containing protein [Limnoraphis robusta]MEA5500005.1 DUF6391 domain-containing protein [Limnoraphis robusta BA-68 BA1]MEA5519349.1 DUF6391 domain-containing protein [Limnoraphis robusta CCNP1315]MEA5539618.1 DUF6391 domain-containing protein [Limnoraphis robusta Tam1]MEA5545607.1 DUF6391 domain-containing protein [Limnoraphis robusta CCNP1324]
MTTATSHSASAYSFPFEFAPSSTQDRDLLRQLNFVPGVKEILMTRQVHALEHATVWVLSEWANEGAATGDEDRLGGMSTAEGFYLYGRVQSDRLRQAVETAQHRLTAGEWDLAVHPRCGTNLSVGMLLTGGVAMGIHLALPKGPVEQLLALGVAAGVATQLSPELGSWAQRYLTTAIPFNLQVSEISIVQDFWGRSAHFVAAHWRD